MNDSQEDYELMKQYEAEKKALLTIGLSAEEYEQQVKELALKLGI